MKTTQLGKRLVKGAAVLATALCAIATPALASGMTLTSHATVPATGLPFACVGGNTLTATGGTLDMVNHANQDAQGVYHVTGTVTPHGVTLQDGSGNVYTLSGAGWFGGKATDPAGMTMIVGGDTEHFVIRDSQGGVYAKVQMVMHVSPNGDSFVFDRGTCEPPM